MRFWFAGLIAVLIVVIAFAGIVHRGNRYKDEACVLMTPRSAPSLGRTIFSDRTHYRLWYRGTYETSGAACEIWVEVDADTYRHEMWKFHHPKSCMGDDER